MPCFALTALPNTLREGRSNRSMAVSILTIKTHIREATVMCLAKHKDLQKQVMDFIIIENHCKYHKWYIKQVSDTYNQFHHICAHLTTITDFPNM